MQLSCRQAPVRSGTRTSSRANAVSVGRHRVTGATARRGAGGRKVSCSTADLNVTGDIQSSGGGRSDGPGQDKRTGGGGDPEGRSEALGWLPDAIQLARLVVIVGGALTALNTFISTATGILTLKGSLLATKADLAITEGNMKDSIRDVKDSVRDVKDSLKTVVTWPYLLGAVGVFAIGRWGK